MAVGAAVPLTKSFDNVDRQTYTTASVTPTAGRTVILIVGQQISSGTPAAPTISGTGWASGLTFNSIVSNASSIRRVSAFIAVCPASPSAGTVSFDCGATQTGCGWFLYEVPDADSGTPTNTKTNQGNSATSGTCTLTTNAGSGSAIHAAYMHPQNEGLTAGASFSLIDTAAVTSATNPTASLGAEERTNAGGTTAAPASWSTTANWLAISFELKLASTTVTHTHTTDALLQATRTASHTTDALLQATLSRSHTTDGLLQAISTLSHTTDALLATGTIERTADHTTDALLVLSPTLSHTTDALLVSMVTRQHTTDALLQSTRAANHTTDALLQSTATASHTTDAILRTSPTLSHTTDALLGGRTISHTTDAYLRSLYGPPASPVYTVTSLTAEEGDESDPLPIKAGTLRYTEALDEAFTASWSSPMMELAPNDPRVQPGRRVKIARDGELRFQGIIWTVRAKPGDALVDVVCVNDLEVLKHRYLLPPDVKSYIAESPWDMSWDLIQYANAQSAALGLPEITEGDRIGEHPHTFSLKAGWYDGRAIGELLQTIAALPYAPYDFFVDKDRKWQIVRRLSVDYSRSPNPDVELLVGQNMVGLEVESDLGQHTATQVLSVGAGEDATMLYSLSGIADTEPGYGLLQMFDEQAQSRFGQRDQDFLDMHNATVLAAQKDAQLSATSQLKPLEVDPNLWDLSYVGDVIRVSYEAVDTGYLQDFDEVFIVAGRSIEVTEAGAEKSEWQMIQPDRFR